MGSKEAHKTSSAQCHCNRFPPCAATIEHHFYFLVLSNYPHVHLCLNGVIIIVTALFCNIYMKKKKYQLQENMVLIHVHGYQDCHITIQGFWFRVADHLGLVVPTRR